MIIDDNILHELLRTQLLTGMVKNSIFINPPKLGIILTSPLFSSRFAIDYLKHTIPLRIELSKMFDRFIILGCRIVKGDPLDATRLNPAFFLPIFKRSGRSPR